MTATYNYRVGDRLPLMRQQLLDGAGAPIPLGTATVTLRLKRDGATGLVLNGAPVNVVDAPNGIVEYAWQVGDLAVAGTYRGEYTVTIGGLPMTVPASGHCVVIVGAVLS